VIVVGHTNDRPIPPAYKRTLPNHLDWSVQLASALVHRFVEVSGCDEAQFLIAGRGEHSPVESNDLDAGRDANQRLEIWLYPASEAPPAPGAGSDQ
jgi:chemotaxis protein MotB